MTLKNPSEFFNTTKDIEYQQSVGDDNLCHDSYSNYANFVDKNKIIDNFSESLDNLSQKVEILSEQIEEKTSKSDLEKAMLSHLMVLDENFKIINNKIKGLNESDLEEFRESAFNLNVLVDNIVNIELPKYKKQNIKNNFYIEEQIKNIKELLSKNVENIRGEVDVKLNDIAEVVDNNIEYFNKKLENNYTEVKETKTIYGNLSKVLQSKINQENEKLKEFSETIQSVQKEFLQISSFITEEISLFELNNGKKFETYKEEINNTQSQLENFVDVSLENYRKELVDVKADVVINEEHLKKVENFIKENYSQIVDLREEVFSEIEKLPVGNIQENIKRLENKIDYIKETYSKIEPEVIVKEVIKEGLINEPPATNNSDPLTPLDKNFVTLDQLQQHYRLFVNRIQQQLSTLGGGGETQLKYLDDVVGIATNASAYDGKFLKYNHISGKFEFSDVDITNDYWANNAQDEVYTLSRVAIGTDRIIGSGSTVLYVDGDARITGILSIGQGTVTIDGNSNSVYVSNIIVQETIVNTDGVGYATETYVNNLVAISTFSGNYNDLFNSPTSLSDFSNDFGYATETYVDTAVSNLIDSAPATLNTLNELAAALADDANFATTVTNSLATKANLSGANFTGIVTATQFHSNNVVVGGATTALLVNGDARVIGILTIGSSSITFSGVDNTVTGITTFTGLSDFTGGISVNGHSELDNVNSSGIVTATGGFVGDLTGDVTGNVTGDVTGNADTATALETARDFSISGDAASADVSFDGTGNVGLAVTLATVNSDVGSYGSSTAIPIVTVNEKGLVTAVSTASVGTALTVAGDSGSENIDLLTETLAISGGTNLTSSASGNAVTVNLDDNISLTSVVASGIVTAADFNSASDIKLKENVQVIESPLEKIIQLEGVRFEWKDSGRQSLGVIAQQVEKVLPEIVSGDESKTVNYNGLIGLLIECVKEQQKEIEDLKKHINK